jgi:hypothetical protein
MDRKEKAHREHIQALERYCADLRSAILNLPRGIVRERLFVLLMQAREQVQRGYFRLLPHVFASMAEVAKDTAACSIIHLLLNKVQDQLSLLPQDVETEKG